MTELAKAASTETNVDAFFEVFQVLRLAAQKAREWIRAHEPLLTSLVETWARYHALDQSGWLPHHTTPFHLLDPSEPDPAVAGRLVGDYYDAEWPMVEAAFRLRIETYAFDAETLATFDEALVAHRNRLFRATPRTLFPDIERKARETLNGAGVTSQASLRDLRISVGALGTSNLTRTGVLSFKLYRMFADHLYSNVKTPERLAQVAADPVPNRHATLHGLVVYASSQSSLNALIMAEYAHLSILAVAQTLADRADPQTHRLPAA
jgi:hypothetical protein